MPWLKVSDRFATHPLLLRLRTVAGADDRTSDEVTGWLTKCSAQSACYLTDYYIDLPTAELFGGSRTPRLLRQATAAGLLEPSGRGNTRRWKIIEDEDLFNIRAREDVEWERQRDRDRRDVELTMPVLARDGDQCRYCLVVVNWRDMRSGRGGTFDHRNPGAAATVDTYVVACRSCNGKRKANPNADQDIPLRPAPLEPYFSPKSTTQARLEEHYGRSFTSASQQQRPSTAPAASGATRKGTAAARPVEDTASGSAETTNDRTAAIPPWSEGGRPDGSGRDGNGSGQEGTGGAHGIPRSRGRRGRRGNP